MNIYILLYYNLYLFKDLFNLKTWKIFRPLATIGGAPPMLSASTALQMRRSGAGPSTCWGRAGDKGEREERESFRIILCFLLSFLLSFKESFKIAFQIAAQMLDLWGYSVMSWHMAHWSAPGKRPGKVSLWRRWTMAAGHCIPARDALLPGLFDSLFIFLFLFLFMKWIWERFWKRFWERISLSCKVIASRAARNAALADTTWPLALRLFEEVVQPGEAHRSFFLSAPQATGSWRWSFGSTDEKKT